MSSDSVQVFLVFVLALLLLKLLLSYIGVPKNLPPGPSGPPVVGYLPHLGYAHPVGLQDIVRKYGPVSSFYLGQKLVLLLSSYEALKEAFVKQADTFAGRPDSFPFRVYDTDNGIITTEGPMFRTFKSFILTYLKDAGAAKHSLELIVKDNAEEFVKYMRTLGAKPTEVLEPLGVSIANTYTILLLGKKFDKKDPWITEMVSLLYREQRAYGNGTRIYMPWTKHVPGLAKWIGEDEIRDVKAGIHRLLELEVKATDKDYVLGSKKNFVHAWYTEAESRKEKDPNDTLFTRLNLRHNMDYVFSAGYDTTVTTLRWAFIYFMMYPDIQERLRKEIDDVIGRDGTPSTADEVKMPFLQATIQEIHRYASIVPLAVNHWNREETTLYGYNIPKHTYIIPNLVAVHFNPERFPEPDVFKPDRFIDSNGKFIRDEQVIPFSIGKRSCPGEPLAQVEIYIYIIYLLQNFIIQRPEGKEISVDRNPSLSSNPKSFLGCFIPR